MRIRTALYPHNHVDTHSVAHAPGVHFHPHAVPYPDTAGGHSIAVADLYAVLLALSEPHAATVGHCDGDGDAAALAHADADGVQHAHQHARAVAVCVGDRHRHSDTVADCNADGVSVQHPFRNAGAHPLGLHDIVCHHESHPSADPYRHPHPASVGDPVALRLVHPNAHRHVVDHADIVADSVADGNTFEVA